MIALGMGSNIGDRIENIRNALNELVWSENPPLTEARLSHVYQSHALLPENAPESWNQPFLNVVLAGKTHLEPLELLHFTQELERKLGRGTKSDWAPRVIDIDLLTWDNLELSTPELNLPHSQSANRTFVIFPLEDVLPNQIIGDQTVREYRLQMEATQDHLDCRIDIDSELKLLGPKWMGILNVTPDSFSDGGKHHHPSDAITQVERLEKEGADIIDLGAESTRPDAQEVGHEIEISRLKKILPHVTKKPNSQISLDTRNAETATWGIENGVDILNDVCGFRSEEMRKVLKNSKKPGIFMHSLDVPVRRDSTLDRSKDPILEIIKWAKMRSEELCEFGVNRNQLIFDPGIGFGKTPIQSARLLRRCNELQTLELPILIGHSRKSFFSQITSEPFPLRDPETLASSLQILRRLTPSINKPILRVHSVGLHRRALKSEYLLRRYHELS